MSDVVEILDRSDFLENYWDYGAGQHVTILGPTGSGKSHLKWQLLEYTATKEVPAIVSATKPRDKTTTTWAKQLGFPIIRNWPPSPALVPRGKPAGRVLWPRHTFDPDYDNAVQAETFRKAMLDAYKKGDQIFDVDEMLDFVDMNLEVEMRTLWTRGRSMGCGLWAGSQQPFNVPTYAYRQSEHLFIFKDPDKRSRDRYDEIGGFDSGMVKNIVVGLQKHQSLYIQRTGSRLCIIDK